MHGTPTIEKEPPQLPILVTMEERWCAEDLQMSVYLPIVLSLHVSGLCVQNTSLLSMLLSLREVWVSVPDPDNDWYPQV